MRQILYFSYQSSESGRRKMQGFLRFAQTRPWQVEVLVGPHPAKSLRKVLNFWKAEGCVVDCAGILNAYDAQALKSTPTVFLDHPPQGLPKSVAVVSHDSEKTAVLAARELIGLGRTSYGFVPTPGPLPWSRIREESFRKSLALHGYALNAFVPNPREPIGSHRRQERLRKWLADLPRPLSLFAANDEIAGETMAAAAAAGLKVPDDVAVVGIDNNELVALRTVPSLTTVQVDFAQAGLLAGKALADLMDGPAAQNETFGPQELVRRGSTAVLRQHDPKVSAATDYIRSDVAKGIGVTDVVRVIGTCRRTAEMRFRAATGLGIGAYILETRVDLAKSYLRRPELAVDSIANFAGWKTFGAFRKAFLAHTGLTPQAWRAANA